jgi:hypothetical protein
MEDAESKEKGHYRLFSIDDSISIYLLKYAQDNVMFNFRHNVDTLPKYCAITLFLSIGLEIKQSLAEKKKSISVGQIDIINIFILFYLYLTFDGRSEMK